MRNTTHSKNTLCRALTLTLLLVASMAACGGSEKPTLKHRLDMAPLAQTPPEERSEVADAYRAHYEAELELAHTQFALKDNMYALKIARAKQAQSKQNQQIAKLEGKRSEAVFMTGLASAATKLLNGMKKDTLAGKSEVSYLKSQRAYLRKHLSYAEAQVLATEAALELAKAKLCKQRGTMPKDFKLEAFVSQEKTFKARATARNEKSKGALAKAKEKEKAWNNARK